MTAWLREVRAMTNELGKKRGRPIKLSARIPAKPAQNLGIGLDPVTWAREGLLDFLTVSHYLRNDFPLPIAEYRRQLPKSLPLYGSVEFERVPDNYRRIARQLWDAGVDGLMLFNFTAKREKGGEPPLELLKELGDPSTIKQIAGVSPADQGTRQAAQHDGYQGIWFTLGQVGEFGDKYSGGLGTYTAKHRPVAIYAPEVNKTFFVYGGAKDGEQYLLNMIGYYDHATGMVPKPVIVHDKRGVFDPHDNATLAIDDHSGL